jgi:hypothetical protein
VEVVRVEVAGEAKEGVVAQRPSTFTSPNRVSRTFLTFLQ